MKNKKFVKTIIALFSLILIFAIGILVFFASTNKKSKNNNDNFLNLNERYALAQSAIFNKHYSHNYNGSYKFGYVAYINFYNYSEIVKNLIFNYYSVTSTHDLIVKFTNEKKSKLKNSSIIINNNKFIHTNKTSTIINGFIYGNDDLSIIYNENLERVYEVSLTNIFNQNLKNITDENNLTYRGTELMIIEKQSLKINLIDCSFDIVLVYNIQK